MKMKSTVSVTDTLSVSALLCDCHCQPGVRDSPRPVHSDSTFTVTVRVVQPHSLYLDGRPNVFK